MVQSIASGNPIKVSPEIECGPAMRMMHEKGVYHLVVEDKSGNFLGMVSMRDCITMKVEEEKERADMYESYAFPNY